MPAYLPRRRIPQTKLLRLAAAVALAAAGVALAAVEEVPVEANASIR